MAFPHREEVLVQGFFNYYDFAGGSLDEIADLPAFEQRRRFGGTLGPTVRLGVEADRTRVRGTLTHWHIPTPEETLHAPEHRGVTPAMLEAGNGPSVDVRARWSRTY